MSRVGYGTQLTGNLKYKFGFLYTQPDKRVVIFGLNGLNLSENQTRLMYTCVCVCVIFLCDFCYHEMCVFVNDGHMCLCML